MPDAPTASEKVVAEIEKPEVREKLLQIARWYAKSLDDARELLQAAVTRALDPEDRPWTNPKWSFLTHMTYLMRDTGRDHAVKVGAREVPDVGVTADEKTRSKEPPADDELDDRRHLAVLRELGGRLLAEAEAKNPFAARVFRLASAGVEEPAEQAAILGCAADEVYDATEWLKRHAAAIRTTWEDEEERRMQGVRALAAGKKGEVDP